MNPSHPSPAPDPAAGAPARPEGVTSDAEELTELDKKQESSSDHQNGTVPADDASKRENSGDSEGESRTKEGKEPDSPVAPDRDSSLKERGSRLSRSDKASRQKGSFMGIPLPKQDIPSQRELQQLRADNAKLRDELRSHRKHTQELLTQVEGLQTERANQGKAYDQYYRPQIRSLEAKVFELAGGIKYISSGALVESYKLFVSKLSGRVPTIFGIPDLKNAEHKEIIAKYRHHFEPFENHGESMFYTMCESWVIKSIWLGLEKLFCGGVENLLMFDENPKSGSESGSEIKGLEIGKALSALEKIAWEARGSTPDVSQISDAWRSYTIRMILSISGIDVNRLAEKDARDDMYRSSPALVSAIDATTTAVFVDLQRVSFPESLYGDDGRPLDLPQHERNLTRILRLFVEDMLFLYLNMRLSRSHYKFDFCVAGQEVNESWMRVLMCLPYGAGRRSQGTLLKRNVRTDLRVVAVPRSPALFEGDGEGRICIAQAEVIARPLEG